MSCQELETVKRLGLNIVIVIFRDNSYGAIKWKQVERYGQASGVDFGNPDFVTFAKSFGVNGFLVLRQPKISFRFSKTLRRVMGPRLSMSQSTTKRT